MLKIFPWTRRLFLALSFLALIATNVLTLTSIAFNAALSGFISTALGVTTVAELMNNKIQARDKTIKRQKAVTAKRKKAARTFGRKVVSRTKRVAAAGIARIPVESIPFIGVSVLIAGTAYELYEACKGLEELDQFYAEIGASEQVSDDIMHSICNPELPEFGVALQ